MRNPTLPGNGKSKKKRKAQKKKKTKLGTTIVYIPPRDVDQILITALRKIFSDDMPTSITMILDESSEKVLGPDRYAQMPNDAWVVMVGDIRKTMKKIVHNYSEMVRRKRDRENG